MLSRRYFLVIASVSYLAVTAWIVASGLRLNDGILVYALDDPYIHMTMARNLAAYGTYGVAAGSYESASSSPAWTLLLAAFAAVGWRSEWVPLWLNVGAAIWVLYQFAKYQSFLKVRADRPETWLAVLLLPSALFLPALTSTGMEHTLHAAATLAIIGLLGRVLAGRLPGFRAWPFYGLMLLAPLLRFEALFLAVGCAAALVLSRKPVAAALTLGAAALPVASYGVVNRLHQQFFLPSSVVAKSRAAQPLQTWLPAEKELLAALRQDWMLDALLLTGAALLVLSLRHRNRRHVALCTAFLITAVLHVTFAAVGWFDRYQAYLLISGTFVVLLIAGEMVGQRRRRVATLLFLAALIVLPGKKWMLTALAPLACHNIYKQQYQMGRFMQSYYADRAVMVNDLGLVAYLHGGPLVDLLGLGSHEVLRARLDGRMLDPMYVQQLAAADRVEVIAIYEIAAGRRTPPAWVKVATWELGESWWGPRFGRSPIGIPPAWSRLVFYAPSASAAPELARNLRAFAPQLPPDEGVEYFQ
jgi:hypothetical protein